MATCTLDDSKGIMAGDEESTFDFDINANDAPAQAISGFAGWFDADFKSRTDRFGAGAPKISNPAYLTTGPEAGYTHWGQQVFHSMSNIPLIHGETTRIQGSLEMTRSKDNARLYNCRIRHESSRRKSEETKDGKLLMKGTAIKHIYQIP
jgi:protein arginine N-methyltransferase 1